MKRNTLIICVMIISLLYVFHIGVFATPPDEEDIKWAEHCFERGLRYRDLAIFMMDYLKEDFYEGYTLDEVWDRAIGSFSEAIEYSPEYADAYYEYGRTCEYLGDRENAYEHYKVAMDLGHESASFKVAEAERYWKLGQEDEVTEVIEEDVPESSSPVSAVMGPDDYYRLGVESYLDDTEAAIDYFTKALELDPDHAEAYCERGRSYERLGDKYKAYLDYHEAAKREYLLGKKYQDRILKEFDTLTSDSAPDETEAESFYEEWLSEEVGGGDVGEDDAATIDVIPGEMEPDDYYNLAVTTANADPKKAIEYLKKAIELKPDYYTAYMKMGEFYQKLGDKKNALESYTYACVYGSIPMACEKADRLASEIADAEEEDEVSSGEKDAEVYYKLGMDIFSDDPEKAILYFTEAIRLNPEYLDAYHQRGLCRYDFFYIRHNSGILDETARKLLDDAIADLSKVIEINPNSEEAYFKRGDSYMHLFHYFGQPTTNNAISDFTNVITLNPNNGEAYYNRGVAHEMNNDISSAIADWRIACSMGVGSACNSLEVFSDDE